jgi:hypothetical protein
MAYWLKVPKFVPIPCLSEDGDENIYRRRDLALHSGLSCGIEPKHWYS